MCLVLLAYRCHHRYPLVVTANRDEYHQRPTQAARWWPDQPTLLAGKDLQAGGTWMGLARNGRFAIVTNYREPDASTSGRSRGSLCRDYLISNTTAHDFLASLHTTAAQYNRFSLLLWDGAQLINYGNHEARARVLSPGIYGLSNGRLNESWPKVRSGRSVLAHVLSRGFSITSSLHLLADRTMPADEALPDTGVGLAQERLLAPRFICSGNYGTRASSVVWCDQHRNMGLVERRFDPEGNIQGQVRFEFTTRTTATAFTPPEPA